MSNTCICLDSTTATSEQAMLSGVNLNYPVIEAWFNGKSSYYSDFVMPQGAQVKQRIIYVTGPYHFMGAR